MQKNYSEIRDQKARKNIISMFAIRGVNIGISFLYVPLLLHALNNIEYGIWLTLISIVAWINMFDVGLGNGLRNKLSTALAENDKQLGQVLISTAYVCIFFIALFFILIFLISYLFIDWNIILNAPPEMSEELNILVFVVIAAFCVQFALNLINSVLFALQLPAFSSLTQLIGQILSFVAVLIEVKVCDINSLLVLGTTISIIPLLTLCGISVYIFRNKYKELAPKISLFNKKYVHSIFSLGLQFFILQIITVILFQSNNLIIAHVVGSSEVVVYNIAYKLMHAIVLIFTIIVTPFWSAATEAYTRHDFDWMIKINHKLLKIIGVLSFVGFILLIISPRIYDIWLRDDTIHIPFSITAILLIQSIFFILYSCYGYLLNGMGKLRIQMIFTSIIAIVYIPFSTYMGKLFGLEGILIIFASCSIFNFLWSSYQFRLVVNQKASGLWNK